MFIVIDGSALLTTCYYGNLPEEFKSLTDDCKKESYHLIEQNRMGTYTNGVSAALHIILDVIQQNHPSHMLVCFDKSRNTFRKELYAAYKDNRKEKPDPLKEQFKTLYFVLQLLGIPTIVSDRYEADDLAGTAISKFKSPFENTYFITKDHDWLQLIDDTNNVKGLLMLSSGDKAESERRKYNHINENSPFCKDFHIPYKMVCYDEQATFDTEHVKPCQIPDKKGLAGDKSDNIPGIYRIGDKTACLVLDKFESLDVLYYCLNRLSVDDKFKILSNSLNIGASIINKLITYKEDALLSKTLATIITDCEEISNNYDDFKLHIDYNILEKVISVFELSDMEQYLPHFY